MKRLLFILLLLPLVTFASNSTIEMQNINDGVHKVTPTSSFGARIYFKMNNNEPTLPPVKCVSFDNTGMPRPMYWKIFKNQDDNPVFEGSSASILTTNYIPISPNVYNIMIIPYWRTKTHINNDESVNIKCDTLPN